MLSTPLLVEFRKLHEDAVEPRYGTRASAGFDLTIIEDVTVEAGKTVMARTGLVIKAPTGSMMMLVPRSSTWKKWGVRLGNTVGIVDADYCGDEDELFLALWNPKPPPSRHMVKYGGPEWQHAGSVDVPAGTRIAQGIFVPVMNHVLFEEKEAMGASRGGWGSTG